MIRRTPMVSKAPGIRLDDRGQELTEDIPHFFDLIINDDRPQPGLPHRLHPLPLAPGDGGLLAFIRHRPHDGGRRFL